MTRYSVQRGVSQRTRTQDNPLFLGTFTETSLRLLKGELRAEYQVQKDGYGGGTYNHWFSVELASPAWIILRKGGANAKYMQTSLYDLNFTPIEGRSIFQADSVAGEFLFDDEDETKEYYPYVGHAMGSQSDLYNTFDRLRLDKGDERYFPLVAGKYFICISTTRNEPRDYLLGLVVEFPSESLSLLLEDLDGSFLSLEDGIEDSSTITIGPSFNSDFILPIGFNATTENEATINQGVTLTISAGSTWFIGEIVISAAPLFHFLLDTSFGYDFNSAHEHSLSEWETTWKREHQETDKFPNLFKPLTTRP